MNVDVFQEGKYLGSAKKSPQKFDGVLFPIATRKDTWPLVAGAIQEVTVARTVIRKA